MTESTALPCLIFDGSLDKDGYGLVWVRLPDGRVIQRAHQLAFYLDRGYLPPVVRHTCDVPACMEPAHLLAGTQLDNVQDRNERGRTSRGEKHATAKLTEQQARAVLADPRTTAKIAADYGIGSAQVVRIKRGTRWAHLQPAA